jgi:NAD(P)-dependent dehydrogenase (short-subunit alcohol dehydrogenase family)
VSAKTAHELLFEGSVEVGIVDLTNLESVKRFAEQFMATHTKLDILINNAGVMMPPEAKRVSIVSSELTSSVILR